MRTYYDTGVALKLYTEERESAAVRRFVTERREPIYLSSLHFAECTSTLRLKVFRRECQPKQVDLALSHLDEDIRTGILKALPVDWDAAWNHCRTLSDRHATATGCRTLDTLHVACAALSPATEFVTTDLRQAALATLAGLTVTNPGGPRI